MNELNLSSEQLKLLAKMLDGPSNELNKLNLSDEQLKQLAKLVAHQSSTELNKEDWKAELIQDNKGKILNNVDNYILFLENDKRYKGKIKYNDFLQQPELNGLPFEDAKIAVCMNDCERTIGLSVKQKFDNAMSEVLEKNHYNPIIDYFDSLVWDGNKRIETLFIDLLDADNTLLNRKLTQKWFIAAVKRVYEPGCKFDNMIVLQGTQGIGKSSICELIAMNFANTISLSEIGDKDLVDKLNKTWIAIIDEMDSFSRKEMSAIKTFVSLQSDATRLAYGHYTKKYMRKCIFIGSTNDTTFLRDSTSSVERRFWVIKCNKTSMDNKIRDLLTKEYVDQLWAEAIHYYKEDPNQYLDIDKDIYNDFVTEMRKYKTYNDDSVIDYINMILDGDYNFGSKGCFDSLTDFEKQVNGMVIYEGQNQKINKIPVAWLRHVLKSKFKEDRPTKYIALAISNNWGYKAINYNDHTYMGFYRKNQIENEVVSKIDNELPF